MTLENRDPERFVGKNPDGRNMSCCVCIKKLRDKEVINICDGRRLGFVDDVEIDVSCGRVVSLVVFMDDGKCFSIGKGEEVMVPWDRIERIGDDVILVSINIEECRVCGRGEGEREKKRRGFF